MATNTIDKTLYARALKEIAAARRTNNTESPEQAIPGAAAALLVAAWCFATQYHSHFTLRPTPTRSAAPVSQGAAAASAEKVRTTMREIASSVAATTQIGHRAKLVRFFTQFVGLREETSEEIVDNHILNRRV